MHNFKLFITITCRSPAHCCFYWNIPLTAYHIQSGTQSENKLYSLRVSALMEKKGESWLKPSGFQMNHLQNHSSFNISWFMARKKKYIYCEYTALFYTLLIMCTLDDLTQWSPHWPPPAMLTVGRTPFLHSSMQYTLMQYSYCVVDYSPHRWYCPRSCSADLNLL